MKSELISAAADTVPDEVKINVALIAASGAILAAIVTGIATVITTLSGRRTQVQLSELAAQIAERKAVRDALRDYEYEARRRLYKECEPLIFRLSEVCGDALRRILMLPQLCETPHNSKGESWIQDRENRLSTLYRLTAPAALFVILRDRLTLFDLSLEPRIHQAYQIARLAIETFSHDRALARLGEKPLAYRPNEDAPLGEPATPEIYSPQGIPDSKLEEIVGVLLENSGSADKIISFPRFLSLSPSDSTSGHDSIRALDYLLRNFTPRTRPVLWRILLAQAKLYSLIIDLVTQPDSKSRPIDMRYRMHAERIASSIGKDPINESGLSAAQEFILPRLRRIQQNLNGALDDG